MNRRKFLLGSAAAVGAVALPAVRRPGFGSLDDWRRVALDCDPLQPGPVLSWGADIAKAPSVWRVSWGPGQDRACLHAPASP